MKILTAKDAKHGRPVDVVMVVEQFERLKGLGTADRGAAKQARNTKPKG